MRSTPADPCRVWPFLNVPFRVFGSVMGPIVAMMATLAGLTAVPTWIRVSAGCVIVVSVYGLYRGYGHRIRVSPDGVRYRSLRRNIMIPWREVHLLDRYMPIDRNLTTPYVYITRLETPPVDRREIDENTIQLQDRPGLLETLQSCWRQARERGR